jgi:hypothetical protein
MKVMEDPDSDNKIIAGSTEQNFVSVWGMSLSQLTTHKTALSNEISFDSFTDTLPKSEPLPKIDISSMIRDQEPPAKIPSRHRPDEKHTSLPPDDLPAILFTRHTTFKSAMTQRLTNIKLVRQSWDTSGVKSAIDTMALLADSAVWCDILKLLNANSRLVSSLEICVGVLPILQNLLFEAHQEYVFDLML